MKAQTIIRIAGLTILMSLTSVGMANAQDSRGRTSENRSNGVIKYKINDGVDQTSRQTPATVYKPGKTSNKPATVKGHSATSVERKAQERRPSQPVVVHQKSTPQQKHPKIKTGSSHSSWNNNYNYRPVNLGHGQNYHKPHPQNRYPHLTMNLPGGFYGFHIDGIRYYHHDGYFYTRHPHHNGYVLTTLPKYFRHIPAGSIKVVIDGRVYFRYHDLFFRHTVFGFKLV